MMSKVFLFVCCLLFLFHCLHGLTETTSLMTMPYLTNTTEPRSVKSCSCVACMCPGSSDCPITISEYMSTSQSCGEGSRVRIDTLGSQSTDGSAYQVFTVDQENLNLFQRGQVFSYFTSLSTSSTVSCFIASPYIVVDPATVHVIFKCMNSIYNCPVKYDLSGSCVAGKATTAEVRTSSTTVQKNQLFSVSVVLKDSSGREDVYSEGVVTLSKKIGPGSLFGSTTATVNSGVAQFSGMSFDMEGTYSLVATFGSQVSGDSSAITVQTKPVPPFPPVVNTGVIFAPAIWVMLLCFILHFL